MVSTRGYQTREQPIGPRTVAGLNYSFATDKIGRMNETGKLRPKKRHTRSIGYPTEQNMSQTKPVFIKEKLVIN